MKATLEQANIARSAFAKHDGTAIESWKAALQAAFDTMTEPTPDMIERGLKAFNDELHTKDMVYEIIHAALNEPMPITYPYAEQYTDSRYVIIHTNKSNKWTVYIPDFMEFDFDKLEMRMKK